jgi:S-DNA-T family DNA segregation ATPase FtsK/SpoIIIE
MSGEVDEPRDHESVYGDGPGELGVPVDPPDRKPVFADVVAWTDNRRPIIPAVLRSRDQRRILYRWAVRLGLHTAAYHAFWSWKYAGRVAWRAPKGAGRLTWKGAKWAVHWENIERRQTARRKDDTEEWLKVVAKNDAERHLIVAGLVVFALVVAGVLLWFLAPWYVQLPLIVGVMLALAKVGSPPDKPITDRVVQGPQFRKLTGEMVRGALLASGYGKEAADFDNFPREIIRDGPGYSALVNLPRGVTSDMIIARRERVAAAPELRLPLDQVWLNPGKHTGQIEMWVADEPVSLMQQPPWPLLSRSAKVDVFKSFQFATDPRLNVINSALMFRNWLIGAMPGAGKTFALRLLLLAAALDPRVELRGYELKGSGDLDALEEVCTEYGSGADDDTCEAALALLRHLYKECLRRGPVIKQMAKAGKAPENKVTPELAGMRSLGLHPLVAFIDECQNLFSHKQYGDEAGELAEKVIKLGRALGIILLLATQRPDAKSLPKGISDNAGVRFCLRVMGQEANDMVLGTSMYKQGIRATQFGDEDLGWGWLVGQGKPTACKGFYVDGPGATRVIARALELRGGPAQPTPRERVPAYNLLDDLNAVWPEGEEKVWSEVLVKRLAELRPEVYGDWVGIDDKGNPTYNTSVLAAALKGYKVSTGQVWGQDEHGKGANRRGLVRADLLAAIDSRRQAQIAASRASRQAEELMALED